MPLVLYIINAGTFGMSYPCGQDINNRLLLLLMNMPINFHPGLIKKIQFIKKKKAKILET